MAKNLGTTSFINLFPEFVYDKQQVAEKSLDIWNSFRIKILNERNNETAFIYHIIQATDTYTTLAQKYYKDQTLWWLIPLANEVEDPFVFLQAARVADTSEESIIKVLKAEYLGNVLFNITNIREFTQSLYDKDGEDS